MNNAHAPPPPMNGSEILAQDLVHINAHHSPPPHTAGGPAHSARRYRRVAFRPLELCAPTGFDVASEDSVTSNSYTIDVSAAGKAFRG